MKDAVSVESTIVVPFRGDVVPAFFDVELHPVVGRRSADDVDFVFFEEKQNRIANDVAVVIAGNKLLALVGLEILNRVDTQIRQQFDDIRALNIEVCHMV